VDAIKALVDLRANIHATNEHGDTPLHAAAAHGHVDAIKTLVDLRANIHATDEHGRIALRMAASFGHVDAIKMLGDLRANIHATDARELQQMDTRLGNAVPAPQVEEEMMCVVGMDERKQHAMVPCMHMCACEACAKRLLAAPTPQCPVCRTPIQRSARVFV
jgi:uncharacterized protein (DUF305 family)